MRALAWIVVAAVVSVVASPPETSAISRRKDCRLGCKAAVDACVAAGGKRARCKRQTLKTCRKNGIETCAVPTTSTTTSPGATITTTTGGGGGSTTTLGSSTTTTPGPTTTSTTAVVHDCNSGTATDLKGQGMPLVTFTTYQYTPPCVRLAAGQTLTFSGFFDVHPLVGGTVVGMVATPDPSSPIGTHASGTMAAIAFPAAGVFPYYCGNHGVTQSMVGAVFVDP